MRRAAGLLALSAAVIGAVLTAGPVLADQKPPAAAPASTGAQAPATAQSVEAQAVSRPARPAPFVELVAASGTGRLYTADPRELASATAAGFKRQPGTTGFIGRSAKTGWTALYRLKPSATASTWLFTSSTQERDALVAQHWVLEGTAGYVATKPGTGLVELRRFTNGKEWRLALAAKTDELLKAGYKLDGPVGYVYQNWVRAGAVYFGMFNTHGHGTIIARTKEIYGRDNDWWGGVRDFHDGTHYATDNWPGEDWSYLKPSIGYYDDSKPETLEKHITQATSAGLSFFNFYWYWDNTKQAQTVTADSLNAFLQARNRESIDFTVGVCAHPYDQLKIPATQYDAVATNLMRYLRQDNTLRTNDGRKILNICDARGLGDGSNAQVKQFVDTVRAKARGQLGEDIYVMINQAGFDPKQVGNAGADAPYCTTDGPAVESRSYTTYLKGQRAFYNQAPAAYGRCVLSDFDERPRYPIETTDVKAIRWMPDQSLDGYRTAVRNAAADMATSTRPSIVDNYLFLYAWNEWHEGGIIEPNERDGCAYLNILHSELSLQGPGCVANPQGTPPS
ncbi:glycoside hydrolase family 99-like domain-containing protein [Kribbella solani]|uniref:glycoside hydrolase family 99-like domain-containing protein n=1 Tax=Kribbella solani TaxID=236067 RepID=UPI0029A1B09A|nr:glycoside hydrolase family 99-like domain-containing protein [Kribbella solani]MDX2969625.1 glycoside hydrolase family 99-like domain-containing protein [Kribbella solani]